MRNWFAGLASRRAAVAPRPEGGRSDTAAPGPAEVTPDTIRAALQQILRSPEFDATARARRFLAYVVEETLEGRAERIKAYSIATDVFGRGADFDAHSDPIVRLEAGRLRRALEQYYRTAGSADPVVVSIPKGGYVPQFALRQEGQAAVAPAAQPRGRARTRGAGLAALAVAVLAALAGLAWTAGWAPWRAAPSGPAVPRLLVRPFDDLSGSDAASAVARGLTQEIIGQMAKFRDIVTVEGERGSPDDHGSRYVLLGGVSLADAKLRLQARVLDAEDVSVLWAETYEAVYEPARQIAIEADLARRVATAIGQPYGVIYKADAGRSRSAASGDWESYSCTLSYFTYRANLDARSHPGVRACLEETVARFPDYATAWALLAQTYMDELRFHYPVAEATAPASLDRAAAAAKRATELDPENVRALQAKMLALYFDGQVEASLAVGERAMLTNPNDTELIGEYGVRLADSGQWKRGCGLVAETLERNPGPLGYYEVILSICAYIERDYEAAKMWVRRAAVMDNPAYHLIAAAVFAEGDEPEAAAAERRWLLMHAPEFVANVRAWVGLKNVPASDRDRFLGSLRRAGLTIPPA
jgi:TolB-like protein